MQMIRPTHKFFSLETEYYRDTVCVYKCLNLVLYDLHDVVMVGDVSRCWVNDCRHWMRCRWRWDGGDGRFQKSNRCDLVADEELVALVTMMMLMLRRPCNMQIARRCLAMADWSICSSIRVACSKYSIPCCLYPYGVDEASTIWFSLIFTCANFDVWLVVSALFVINTVCKLRVFYSL